MKDTKRIGDITAIKVTAALMAKGYTVLQPYGDNERYDIVIEHSGKFSRIQCKTGRAAKSGNISFNTKSVSCNGQNVRDYKGQIDFFGVYYPINDTCYLVPVDKVGSSSGTLQLDKSSMSRTEGIWASEFKI